jgi:hypothetical protein
MHSKLGHVAVHDLLVLEPLRDKLVASQSPPPAWPLRAIVIHFRLGIILRQVMLHDHDVSGTCLTGVLERA